MSSTRRFTNCYLLHQFRNATTATRRKILRLLMRLQNTVQDVHPIRTSAGYRASFRIGNLQYRAVFSYAKYKDPFRACLDYIEHKFAKRSHHDSMTLTDQIDSYIHAIEVGHKKRYATIMNDRRRLIAFSAWANLNGVRSAGEINIDHIRRFERFFHRGGTLKPGNTPSGDRANTWLKYRCALSVFFKYAINYGWMKENFAQLAEFRTPIQEKIPERIYSPTDLYALFGAIDTLKRPDLSCFYRLLAYTGMRLGEALQLRWQNVNLKNGVILVAGETKSRKVRAVPIVPQLETYLKAISHKHELVFCRPDGSRWLTPGRLYRLWVAAHKQAKVQRGRLHDLRHTFGTTLANSDVHVRDIKELMGHQQISTTMRYLHSNPAHLKAAIRKLPY